MEVIIWQSSPQRWRTAVELSMVSHRTRLFLLRTVSLTSPWHFPGPLFSSHPSNVPSPALFPGLFVRHRSIMWMPYFLLFNTFLYTPPRPHNIPHIAYWLPPVTLLFPEFSPQVMLMILFKALSDPGCQMCHAQIIWALCWRGCFPLRRPIHLPLVSGCLSTCMVQPGNKRGSPGEGHRCVWQCMLLQSVTG